MSRLLRALVVAGLLASCGGGDYSAPRDLDNACAILNERPHYVRALRAAERKWNVPAPVLMAMIYQESKFIGNARTPVKYTLGILPMGRQSSAYGYSQALDGTWEEYTKSTGRWRAKRDDIRDATDFMGWYMNRTQARNGIDLGDATRQYLAYHEGHTGYARASYTGKPWLMRVAGEVGTRANTYAVQLERCRRWS